MQTFAKKQITIICERPLLNRIRRLLDREPVTGYTILPALGGKGANGPWDRDGMVGDAGQMVQVVCILDASRLESVLDDVFALVGPQQGIVTVQNVEVVRPAHF